MDFCSTLLNMQQNMRLCKCSCWASLDSLCAWRMNGLVWAVRLCLIASAVASLGMAGCLCCAFLKLTGVCVCVCERAWECACGFLRSGELMAPTLRCQCVSHYSRCLEAGRGSSPLWHSHSPLRGGPCHSNVKHMWSSQRRRGREREREREKHTQDLEMV